METTKPLCPSCKSQLVTQVPRAGLLDQLAALFSLHPFQCDACKKRFRLGGQSSSDGRERRKALRLPVEMPVTFESKEVSGEGTLTDISPHGCSLVSKQPLRSGLLLRLYLPVSKGQKPGGTVQQLATVMGVSGNRAGLKFLAYSSEEKNALNQTVTRSMKIFAR